jgi:hypothetical protein
MYAHVPRGSLFLLPQSNFPILLSADYNRYELQVMPADPQTGASWMDEANLPQVERWIAGQGHQTAYVVLSRSMSANADYYGAPKGYAELVRTIPTAFDAVAIFRNDDVTIYRLTVGGARSATRQTLPTAPARVARSPRSRHARAARSARIAPAIAAPLTSERKFRALRRVPYCMPHATDIGSTPCVQPRQPLVMAALRASMP